MTYIIAGKLKDKSFIMSDCIVIDEDGGEKTYEDKVTKLESSRNLFFSFTGTQFVQQCVCAYDLWLSSKNKENDFISGEKSMKELLLIIDKMLSYNKNEIQLDFNRLFFLDKNAVVYYDLKFDEENKLPEGIIKKTLNTGEFINSASNGLPRKIEFNRDELEGSCKNYLHTLSDNKIDFMDRFTFIQILSDDKAIVKRPFKIFSDVIAMYYNIDYNRIDKEDFKWDIISA